MHSAMEVAHYTGQHVNLGTRCNVCEHHPFLSRCYELGFKSAERDHLAIRDRLNTSIRCHQHIGDAESEAAEDRDRTARSRATDNSSITRSGPLTQELIALVVTAGLTAGVLMLAVATTLSTAPPPAPASSRTSSIVWLGFHPRPE